MPRKLGHHRTAALTVEDASANWSATIERDGGRCRVAAFLPDLPCSGSLVTYNPLDLSDLDPRPDDAITICDGHLQWVCDNHAVAIALGLAR
jgi:hypothetical protein